MKKDYFDDSSRMLLLNSSSGVRSFSLRRENFRQLGCSEDLEAYLVNKQQEVAVIGVQVCYIIRYVLRQQYEWRLGTYPRYLERRSDQSAGGRYGRIP